MNAHEPRLQDPDVHHLEIEFTGSGSEYFRIWIVNLLLTLVTLSLYFPWAKVRRLRYFYGNTLVGGEPLGFHGNPRTMFKGYVLIGLLFILYSAAGRFSPMAGGLALLVVMALAPALLHASMRFRLANSSWRGLRFSFTGSRADAYLAALPLVLPVAVGFCAALAAWYVRVTPAGIALLSVGMLVATVGVVPWLFWNLKRYQHDHYALASLQTNFTATLGSFYRLLAKVVGVAVLVLILPAVLGAGAAFAMRGGAPNLGRLAVAALTALPLLLSVILVASVKPYLTSRLQNLVWTRTGNRSFRFLSALRFKPLLWLTLRNWLLIILTLGLYWPFAAVALAGMRLRAVSVRTRDDPESLVSRTRADEDDAAGEAAGDLFGFDIGF